jgi:hypothetical protein
MSNTSTPDPVADRGRDQDRDAADGRLSAVVVTYDGSPDRRTLYPPAATETERLTRWLTADADSFRRVEEMR